MNNNSKKIDDASLERAIKTAQQVLGAKESAKIEKMFKDKSQLEKMTQSLSQKDLETVNGVLSNPEMLKKILSTPKAREGLKKFLGE